MDNVSQASEPLASLTQRNIEAMMRSSQIWTAGFQEIGRTMAAMAKAQFENGMTTCKAMGSVKSLAEAAELQAAHAHRSCADAMADARTLHAATVTLAEQTMAPLKEHLTPVS